VKPDGSPTQYSPWPATPYRELRLKSAVEVSRAVRANTPSTRSDSGKADSERRVKQVGAGSGAPHARCSCALTGLGLWLTGPRETRCGWRPGSPAPGCVRG
jgi:hypothetical protein